MRIIVPMAGMGKRMRPHTLTVPKPLIKLAGKPIVQRLCEDLAAVCDEKIDEIAFVVGRFGEAAENQLKEVAASLGAEGTIHYQDEALGTAHAILCAQSALKGKVIIAFADTLFKTDLHLDENKDGIIWTQKIDDPSQFGVVQLDDNGAITDYVEKPEEFVSDLAMIGVYYIKDGENLHSELQYLLDNNIIKGGEYQLPDAFRNMTAKGLELYPGTVDEWLDCGNKNATVYTNQRVLELKQSKEKLVSDNASITNSVVVQPCYIADGVRIINSVVGPHVSIGKNTVVSNTIVTNSIIQDNAELTSTNVTNSMIGNAAKVTGSALDLSISDFSTFNR